MTRFPRLPRPDASQIARLHSETPSLALFLITIVAIPAAFAKLAAGLIGG